MFDFNEDYGRRAGNKIGGGRYLCTAVLLAFILSISFFSSACGGGSTGTPTPGNGNPGNGNPGNAVTISFGSFSYSASEGGSVVITVTLSAGLERSVTIPLVVDTQSTAAAGDYSGLQGVTFASGETTKNITLTITDDTENEGSETVILGFGTLPQGVTAGTTSTTTVTIADNDAPPSQVPAVTVSFGSFSYSAMEGQAAVITVTLSAAPGRTVVVPFTVTGTAQAGDYSGVPANVTFASGETLKSFTLTATDDTADEQNETVILAFGTLPQGVSAGTTSSTTVMIIDNDDAPPSQTPAVTVGFGTASHHSIMEGQAVVMTVTLSADPERSVVIPFTVTGTAQAEDYSGVPANVTFASGETLKSFTLTATDDSANEQSETVVLGFGTLPEGVTAGTISSTTITIADNEGPAVTVSLRAIAPVVTEGGGNREIVATLSADPERTVTIPIMVAAESTASAGDYSLSANSVTFASGETVKIFSLTAVDDSEYEGDETIVLTFGMLPEGVSSAGTYSITLRDNDPPPAVTVSFGQAAYSAAEGGTAATVAVKLSADPERSVTIPFMVDSTSTAQDGDYSLQPATSVTFASGETTKSITLTATDDTADDDDETVVLTFGTLPERVTAGTPSSTTVTITDNDDPPPAVTVSFGTDSSVTEGFSRIVVITLSVDPRRSVTVPITVDTTSTAQAADYSLPANSVTFASGDTEEIITLTAVDDTEDEGNETVVLGFGTLPEGVTAGMPSTVTITIEDNDDAPGMNSCDNNEVISVMGNYDAKTADPDPDGEGLFICGNPAGNFIRGGDGDDTIMGNNGSDTLQGRDGDDTINGGPGVDWVIYRTTNEDDGSELDNLRISLADGTTNDGHGGMDTLTGIENVRCEGGLYDPVTFTRIVGDDADNRIACGPSLKNILHGGGGNDMFVYSYGENWYSGGNGMDTLDFSGLSSVSGTLTVALNLIENGGHYDPAGEGTYGKTGNHTYSIGTEERTAVSYVRLASSVTTKGQGQADIENIIGSGFSDELTGHDGENRIEGGGGNDTIRGEGEADELIGGGGADTLIGGPGSDTYYADFSVTVTDTVVEAAGEGDNDKLFYNHVEGESNTNRVVHAPGTTTPANVEVVYGTKYADTIRAADNGVEIYGGNGDDTLYGGAGNDTLRGENGNDTFEGGGGSDIYYATSAEEGSITDSGGSDDTLYYTDTAAIAHGRTYEERNNGSTPSNIETVYGTRHDDRIRSIRRQNNEYDITLVGGAGDDHLYGDRGKDIFVGCGGRNEYYSRTGSVCDACGWAPQDQWGNDFVVTVSSGGEDRILDFLDNDTLYLMDYAGSHDDLTITRLPDPALIKITMASSAKTVFVRTIVGERDQLLARFKNQDSGRIKFSTSDHPRCGDIN